MKKTAKAKKTKKLLKRIGELVAQETATAPIQPNLPPFTPDDLPGNDDPGELPDLSFASDKQAELVRHIEARKKATGGKPPEHVGVFFNEFDNSYVYKMGAEYVVASEQEIKRNLKKYGFSEKWKPSNGWTELEWPCANAFDNRRVKYAGPIPGHKAGPRTEEDGRKLLVTEEAAGVWPSDDVKLKGEPVFFTNVMTLLLKEGSQYEHFFYMMAAWLRALRDGAWTPGPVTWFVGKKDFGKSLALKFIKHIFGGRVADPSLPLLTDNNFSGHLLRGEIWIMDDPLLPTRTDQRMALATKLKTFFHSRSFTFNDKGKRALTVDCWRRSCNGVNDQHEDLMGLPPMRDGVTDKNCIYRCSDAREAWARFHRQAGLPGVSDQSEGLDQNAMATAIALEAPQARAWLLSEFKNVPERYKDERYGVKAIQHSGLFRELADLSPEAKFLSYVEEVLFEHDANATYPHFSYDDTAHAKWKSESVDYPFVLVTSKELESRMQRSNFEKQVANRLHLAGKDLGRLCESHPERVSEATMRNGARRWRINNPFRAIQETKLDV